MTLDGALMPNPPESGLAIFSTPLNMSSYTPLRTLIARLRAVAFDRGHKSVLSLVVASNNTDRAARPRNSEEFTVIPERVIAR